MRNFNKGDLVKLELGDSIYLGSFDRMDITNNISLDTVFQKTSTGLKYIGSTFDFLLFDGDTAVLACNKDSRAWWREKRLNDSADASVPVNPNSTALTSQIGGSYYKDMKIQPIEFIHANKLDFLQGNVIKYVCRHKNKNGKQDVEKAMHYLQLILDLEYSQEK